MDLGIAIKAAILAILASAGITVGASQNNNHPDNHGAVVSAVAKTQSDEINEDAKLSTSPTPTATPTPSITPEAENEINEDNDNDHGLSVSSVAKGHGIEVRAVAKE